MNGIILYGSRYGAARQYAQALEERTGLPAVSYAEVRDFGPFDTIVYVGGLYAGKTTGLAKTARRLPTDHPFRLLVATVGLADPANEDNLLSIRESLAKELSPGIFVRTGSQIIIAVKVIKRKNCNSPCNGKQRSRRNIRFLPRTRPVRRNRFSCFSALLSKRWCG